MSRQLPTLRNHIIIAFLTVDIAQAGSSPQVVLECRFQTNQFITIRFHHWLTSQTGQIRTVTILQLAHTDLDNHQILCRTVGNLMCHAHGNENISSRTVFLQFLSQQNGSRTADHSPVFRS